MKRFPALDLPAHDDMVLAALDDFAPTAIEEREPGARVFFATARQRDAARAAMIARHLMAVSVDVPDDDWAARSQQDLPPVTVGRIRIVSSAVPRHLLKPWPGQMKQVFGFRSCLSRGRRAAAGLVTKRLGALRRSFVTPQSPTPRLRSHESQASFGEARQSGNAATAANPLTIVIVPSMGFGTGHHASTRLCLAAMQHARIIGSFVLDIGTGSGILAIAAARLGASRALGIDIDADAVESARRNLAWNPEASQVSVALAELASDSLPVADIVLANLTGPTLVRWADTLLGAARPGGTLILSGILGTDENSVREAFLAANLVERTQEDEWVCLRMKKT